MFTVLIRFRSDGREQLFSAKSVEYDPKDGFYITLSDGKDMHYATSPEEGTTSSDTDLEPYADAYIMNKEGKTVARYVL